MRVFTVLWVSFFALFYECVFLLENLIKTVYLPRDLRHQ